MSTVEEVITQADSLLGKETTIEGILVAEEEACWLAADYEAGENRQNCIEVQYAGLFHRLLGSVPPAGGGKYFYLHPAKIRGTVAPAESAGFTIAVTNLSSLVVSTSLRAYRVPL